MKIYILGERTFSSSINLSPSYLPLTVWSTWSKAEEQLSKMKTAAAFIKAYTCDNQWNIREMEVDPKNTSNL